MEIVWAAPIRSELGNVEINEDDGSKEGMIRRWVKAYVIVTSVVFTLWVGLAVYIGLEENTMAKYCDYGAPKKWEYYTSQGVPYRPRHHVILKEIAVVTATILIPLQFPAYMYFMILAIVRRRRMQASDSRELIQGG